jgi:hypothetical protein
MHNQISVLFICLEILKSYTPRFEFISIHKNSYKQKFIK